MIFKQKYVNFQLFIIGIVLFSYSSLSFFEASASSIDDLLDWQSISPLLAPPALFSSGMTYDSESDRIILFSGAITPYVVHNGTWSYDYNTNTWENMSPVVKPGGRGSGVMVYDEESDRIILFGGIRQYYAPPEPLQCWSDTWAYDYNTNTWENMTPEFGPRSRGMHNLAYDSESDRVILYGGAWGDASATGGRGILGDTWAYDYNTNTWTNMTLSSSPLLLYVFGMAYDSESDRVVIYGGHYKDNGDSSVQHETWTYDFNSNLWTLMDPPTFAHDRMRFQMVYHSLWDRVLLFGGDSQLGFFDDTWAYDYNSNNWTELHPINRPSKRIYSDLAYDKESDKVLLFGGLDSNNNNLNETWALNSSIKTTTTTESANYSNIFIILSGSGLLVYLLNKRRKRRH